MKLQIKNYYRSLRNGYQNIRTDFTSRDFSINKESLLLLKPDVVYYYGEFQKAGTDKMPLQSVNVDIQESDPEKITIQWEQLLSQSLALPYKEIMKTQWNRTKEKCAKLKNNVIVPKRGLFVFSSLNGRITVSGKKTYGASYLEKAGISNVANSFSGNKEIGLEQLYAWAPNVVFLFLDSDKAFARSSKIQHSKNKMFIYHIPEGVFSWGSPCAESPLMPLWLFSRAYPQIYTHEDFKKDAKQFYTNTFRKYIPNRVLNSVLMDQ